MPELAEVETIRRQLEPRLVGRLVVSAWGFLPPKFDQAPRAIGAVVTGVNRRGKYLLAALHDQRELILHLGMTGALELLPVQGYQPDPYVRAWWGLDNGEVLQLHDVRRFGRVAVVPVGEYGSLPTLATLGPEPLSSSFTPGGLREALSGHQARIKTQLLSQRPVAGLGNIYADEALWRARVHPGARSISKPQAARLHDSIRAVLEAAIANGGTTLRDYRGIDGTLGENQFHLDCYGRSGLPCRRCGHLLTHRVWDARRTTFCAICQRR